MKKILTLLALMVATVAAFAAFAANRTQARSMEENNGVLTYEQSLFCQGGWMFGDTPIETKKVTMTVKLMTSISPTSMLKQRAWEIRRLTAA